MVVVTVLKMKRKWGWGLGLVGNIYKVMEISKREGDRFFERDRRGRKRREELRCQCWESKHYDVEILEAYLEEIGTIAKLGGIRLQLEGK